MIGKRILNTLDGLLGRCVTFSPLGSSLGVSVSGGGGVGGDQAPVSKLEGAARLSGPNDQVPETEPVHRTRARTDTGARPRPAEISMVLYQPHECGLSCWRVSDFLGP